MTRHPARTPRPILSLLRAAAVLVLLVGTGLAGADREAGWTIGERPDWVVPLEPFVAAPSPVIATERPRGVDVRLFERQTDLRGTAAASWYAIERAYLTRDGVTDHSRFEITFDPAYQSVVLDELSVRRGDRVLDRLGTVRARVLDTEPELDSALYHGRRTLSLLVDDVRVGDVMRVAFTRYGNNPVLGGLREYGFHTERTWKTEGRTRLRVLSDAIRPLHVRAEGPVPEPVETVSGAVRETVVDQAFTPAREIGDDVPPRLRDPGRIVVSDVADWKTIVDWARPMYAAGGPVPDELLDVAADIRERHDDRRARIGAALTNPDLS